MSVVDVPPFLAPGRLGFARKADVDLFVERLEAFETGQISPDDWRSFRLLNGVYGQRQDGVMMIRAKLPGGFVTPTQLEALADVAEVYAGGKGHVTTRQNVQFHFVPMADVEAALRRLAAAGITTREACGHSVRNWTCCPFAGVARDEPFDPTPYVEALARHLLRGPYSSSLPRKFKPSVGGCCGTDCSQAFINDLGFLARTRAAADGTVQRGFLMIAGGGLSTLRRSALTVEDFVPEAELLEAADAVVRVFHRIGNRHNRAKARLKWAIDKIGRDAFLAEYRAERDRIRAEGGAPLVLPLQPAVPPRRAPLAQVASVEPGYAEWAAHNVRPQKQAGFSSVVIRLVLGDITAVQLRGLALLATSFGEGEVRTTNEQNLVLRYVPDARLPALHRELVRTGLAHKDANTVADVTSCPGASSCKIAVTASRGLGAQLTELLDRRPDLIAAARGVDIKVSGCPNGCGQHYIAGIGFQGGMRKLAGRPAPQYLVYVGGGIRADGADFGRLLGKVPARRAAATVERLLDFYIRGGGTSHAFWTTIPTDQLRSLIADLTELAETDATEDDFIDLGEARAFEVVDGEGECAS
ncbi:MAG: nitrite/sulfite reductase [Deltaproteobacteria bacterium]|nr:MAG: nitrite/sulfite reductase [Deltaproteobacteria bacterium]